MINAANKQKSVQEKVWQGLKGNPLKIMQEIKIWPYIGWVWFGFMAYQPL